MRKNLYLDALASNEFCKFLNVVVFESIMPLQNAHELWTKLLDKHGKSMTIEDDCSFLDKQGVPPRFH